MKTWLETTRTNTYELSRVLDVGEVYTLSMSITGVSNSPIEFWLGQTYIGNLVNDKITFTPTIANNPIMHIKYIDNILIEWVKLETGESATSWSNAPEDLGLDKDLSFNYGTSTWIMNGVAKHGWMGSNGMFMQNIILAPDTDYTLSGKVYKQTPMGIVRITLNNSETGDVIQEAFLKEEGEEFNGQFSFQFNSGTLSNYRIIIYIINANVNLPIEMTDLMLAQGANYNIWSQAAGEVYTLNVRVDGEGINVYSSDNKGKTVMSPEEFAGYYNNQKVFTLNGDITEVMGLYVGGKGLFIPPVKFVQTNDSLDIVWTGREG